MSIKANEKNLFHPLPKMVQMILMQWLHYPTQKLIQFVDKLFAAFVRDIFTFFRGQKLF